MHNVTIIIPNLQFKTYNKINVIQDYYEQKNLIGLFIIYYLKWIKKRETFFRVQGRGCVGGGLKVIYPFLMVPFHNTD